MIQDHSALTIVKSWRCQNHPRPGQHSSEWDVSDVSRASWGLQNPWARLQRCLAFQPVLNVLWFGQKNIRSLGALFTSLRNMKLSPHCLHNLKKRFFCLYSSYRGNIVFQVSKTSTHFMFSVCLSQHFSFSSSKQFQAVSSSAHAVQLHPFNTRWCLGTWGIVTDTTWMKEEWLLQNVNGGLPKLSVMCREIPWNTQHPISRWSKKMYQLPRFAYSQSCKKWRCALNLT